MDVPLDTRTPVLIGIAWYGIFVAVLAVILYFNYAIIPDSIIPPPDYIRQRLGWMN